MTNAIIDFASSGLSLHSIRKKINNEFFKDFSLSFIKDTIKRNQERLDPEILANLLSPEELRGTKKM